MLNIFTTVDGGGGAIGCLHLLLDFVRAVLLLGLLALLLVFVLFLGDRKIGGCPSLNFSGPTAV